MFITKVYDLTYDDMVVLMTMLAPTVTEQAVCALMVHTGDPGLMSVRTDGRVVMRNPFSKL